MPDEHVNSTRSYTAAMEQLVAVVQELSQAHDIDTVMRIVRTSARTLTGADGATFVLRDGDRCHYVDEDAISPLWKGQKFPMSACISGWAMLNQKSAVIEDIYKDERIPADAYRPTFVKSLVMVPIRQKSPIGAIGNYWAQTRKPTDEEVKILQALADATSVTIKNIELYDALQRSYQQREKAVLDKMSDGIITIDTNGMIENYNKAAERIFGYPAEEVIGQSINMLMSGDVLGENNHHISQPEDAGGERNIVATGRELSGRRKSGDTFPAEISVTEIRVSGSRFFSAIVRDISDRKAYELQLLQAKHGAESANQIKSEFLANMSHELRTPLNSIIGLSRMLYEDKSLSEEHRDAVGIAYRSANNLLDIVNDILDLSKIEADALELEKIVFAPQEVISGVMEIFLPLCSQKGLILTCNLPSNAKLPYLVGDPTRLGRVIVNLISNAVKYTERGSVTFDVNCTEDENGNALFSCSVTDTGIGIPADKIDAIFDKFVQADASITRKYGGTGLGLNITRYLVNKMGGEIGLTSTIGEGSRFWFTIPFETSKSRPAMAQRTFRRAKIDRLPAEKRKAAKEVKILVGEDHLLNQGFMKRLLPRMGFGHFDIVDNGKMVIDTLKNKEYDLVLMDCHMPVMSGYEAVAQLRASEKNTDKHIPVIAMTADAMIGTREKCLIAGMDDYISKPLNPDELRMIISRWVTFSDEEEDGASAPSSKDTPKDEGPSLKAFANNEEELRHLVDLFIRQSEDSLDILRQNCLDGRSVPWIEAAHKLKGGAAVVTAKRLAHLCEKAQKMETSTARERKAVLNEISAEYNKVKEALLLGA